MDPLTIGLMGFSALSTFYGAQQQADAISFQNDLNQIRVESNARIKEMQADETIKKGDRDLVEFQKSGSRLKGAQRAALAAQGIDIDSGSAAELLSETDEILLQDSVTIRNNAMFEAYGLRSSADQDRLQGYLGELQSSRQASTTLISGGLGAIQAGISTGSAMGFFKGSGVKSAKIDVGSSSSFTGSVNPRFGNIS